LVGEVFLFQSLKKRGKDFPGKISAFREVPYTFTVHEVGPIDSPSRFGQLSLKVFNASAMPAQSVQEADSTDND